MTEWKLGTSGRWRASWNPTFTTTRHRLTTEQRRASLVFSSARDLQAGTGARENRPAAKFESPSSSVDAGGYRSVARFTEHTPPPVRVSYPRRVSRGAPSAISFLILLRFICLLFKTRSNCNNNVSTVPIGLERGLW